MPPEDKQSPDYNNQNPTPSTLQGMSHERKGWRKIFLLFNVVPAVLYLFFVIFLVITNRGSTGPEQIFYPTIIFLIGAIVFAPIILIDFIVFSAYLYRTRHKTAVSNARKIILVIWLFILAGLLVYAVNSYSYYKQTRLSEAKVVQLIRGCKVAEIQKINNSETAITQVDEDASLGAVTTRADFNTLQSELNSVKQYCAFEKRAYWADTPIVRWVKIDETLRMIKDCKINSIQADAQNGLISDNPEPQGTPTGILFVDHGGDGALIYADEDYLVQIDQAVKQANNPCGATLNYAL